MATIRPFHYVDTFGGDLTRIDRFLGYNRGNRAFVALFFFLEEKKEESVMGFGEHQKIVRRFLHRFAARESEL